MALPRGLEALFRRERVNLLSEPVNIQLGQPNLRKLQLLRFDAILNWPEKEIATVSPINTSGLIYDRRTELRIPLSRDIYQTRPHRGLTAGTRERTL